MRHILHDWNDEQCIVILCNCRKSIGTRKKVLVVEIVYLMSANLP
jgi:hypothetical protein